MADVDQDGSSRSSSRGSSFSLCHMAESAYAKVIFCEIHDSYSTDADVECLYQLSESVVPRPDDYIGLFRVGWQDLADCITSVPCASSSCNSSIAGDSYHKIIFKVKDLPKDDLEYYQFLYLTGDHEICGASTPFKFHNLQEDENIIVLSPEHDFLEVKSSTTLLHHRLAETQKHVAFLEKAKKQLEEKIVMIEKENDEAKEKMEKMNLEQKDFESQLHTCLTAVVVGAKVLPVLPKCTEALKELIYNVKGVVDGLSKDNTSLRTRKSIVQRDLAKLKADFESFKSKEVQAARQNTAMTDSVKSSLQLLNKENAELKEERCSLQKSLNDTKDLFRASEECKSLVLQELENVKKSKDEMSSSMEDLKLLNSLLKKQLANNENAIKEMEKVWRELEEVKTNFDSEKESWEKQRGELDDQVRDLTVRLQEAAELYKKQFLEIRSLKKHIRSYESARRKLSNDKTNLSNDYVKCSSSDSLPSSLEDAQTPPYMTQSLASLTDSSVMEHISKSEVQCEAVPNSSPANVSTNYLAWSACPSLTEITVGKASAPAEEISAPRVESSAADLSTIASAAVSKLMIVDRANPSEMECVKTETFNSSQASSLRSDLQEEQNATHSSNIASSEIINSSDQSNLEMFDLPCPLCEDMITVYENNTASMDEHLLQFHNQQLCPICGRMFDQSLPSNYFKYHVEHHFSRIESTQ